MKNPADRIRELEDHCEALEYAFEEIKTATWASGMTLRALRRRIGQIMVAARDRKKRGKPFGSTGAE